MDCYYYQWHTPHFCWDSFDTDAALYRARYGAMMKAAAVYVTECYPALRAFLCDGRRSLGRVGYLAAFFRRSYPRLPHAPGWARGWTGCTASSPSISTGCIRCSTRCRPPSACPQKGRETA